MSLFSIKTAGNRPLQVDSTGLMMPAHSQSQVHSPNTQHPTPNTYTTLLNSMIEAPQTHDLRAESSTVATPTTTLPAASGAAHKILGKLSTQLETVLRNADTLIQLHPDVTQLVNDRTKQVLRQLNEPWNNNPSFGTSKPNS
jgi:hypothetical protein